MELIRYTPLAEAIPPTTPVFGYSYRDITPLKKTYRFAPIVFEAGVPFEYNPYYQIINLEHGGNGAKFSLISYRNPASVEPYLASHPEIQAFLEESREGLETYFGKAVRVILEVIDYPGEHPHEELVGWIQSADPIDVGVDKLEKFEAEWLTRQLQKVGNVFNFNLEFA